MGNLLRPIRIINDMNFSSSTIIVAVVALVIGGLGGFFYGQRNPTFESVPQYLPHIPNRILAEMSWTSAAFRNPEFYADASGSIVSITDSQILISGGDENSIGITVDNSTQFVDASVGTETPIISSDLQTGDKVVIKVKVANEKILAVKVTRQ